MLLNEVLENQIKIKNEPYHTGSVVRGNNLSAGMMLSAHYKNITDSYDTVEILGFTDDKDKYGKGGVKFKSIKDVFKHYGVNNLSQLEKLQDENEYGFHTYMVVKDLQDGDSGPWYYLYGGKWSRGSGADRIVFRQLIKVH